MTKNSDDKEQFYPITKEVKDSFMKIYNEKSFPFNLGMEFICNIKQKQLIKISKIQPHFQFLLDSELLISVNEEIYDLFDEESINILFEQEIDKIHVNIDNGKIKMVKPDLITFSPIVSKYGFDAVARANQVEDLTLNESDQN